MASSIAWQKIFDDHKIGQHDFTNSPFIITSKQIKRSCQDFTRTGDKEVRILCYQTSREDRPQIFIENNLFILPVKNDAFAIIEGEGYVDIPEIESDAQIYTSKLGFFPDTTLVGNSEMQHLDYAYATSLIRSFTDDESFVLTVRGRKRITAEISFAAGLHEQTIHAKGVQTEVDAGYESKDKILLVEAKNSKINNVIIRQMYYPFRFWQANSDKPVHLIFFEKRNEAYCIWQFVFDEKENYNSIRCVNKVRFSIS